MHIKENFQKAKDTVSLPLAGEGGPLAVDEVEFLSMRNAKSLLTQVREPALPETRPMRRGPFWSGACNRSD